MKNLFCIMTAFLFVVCNSFAQYFWTEQVSGVSTLLLSVSNIDGINAWVSGYNGTVIKTSNSGYNWQNLSGNGLPSNNMLLHIFGVSSTTALTVGYFSGTTNVYRTSNSGGNWNLVFTQAGGFINGIWMHNQTEGFMYGDRVGGRWSLWKTLNGGVNWDSTGLFLPETGGVRSWNNSIWGNAYSIWFGTDASIIYHTTNYNSSPWVTQSTAPNSNIYSIWFNQTGMLGFFGGDSLSKTTNGGANWIITPSLDTGHINGFASIQFMNNYWYIRSSNNIYFSNNGGPFSIQYTTPSGSYLHMSGVRSGFTGGAGAIYAVRDNGGISRLNFFVEGVTIISSEIPDKYVLFQNYPNPFNASTIFKFDAPRLPTSSGSEVRGGYIRLITYNALGQETGSLVNEVLQPGTYKVEWFGNDKPSGIYFYRLLVTDPNSRKVIYNETRKMVMIK